MPASPSEVDRPPLVIGCGALAPELVALTRRAGLPAMDLACLPATLHNRPERIPERIRARIQRARAEGYDRIFVAYADCGTGGLLDLVLEAERVDRLDGAHCYEVFAGRAAFAALADEEPGTFYLTDFLARNFDRLVIRGLGLDRHAELLPVYFGNYRRLVFLAQTDDARLTAIARRGARRLGLAFERRFTGLGELRPAIRSFGIASDARTSAINEPARPSHAESVRVAQEPDLIGHGGSSSLRPAPGNDRQVARATRYMRRTQRRVDSLRRAHDFAGRAGRQGARSERHPPAIEAA